MRGFIHMCAIATCLVALPAQAQMSIDVQAISGFTDGVKTIAVLPGDYPESLDYVIIEGKLEKFLVKYTQFKFILTADVRQFMFESGIDTCDEEAKSAIAEKFGADAFLVPSVLHAGTTSGGDVAFVNGGIVTAFEIDVVEAKAELELISASDGRSLMKGTGMGATDVRTQEGIVATAFKKILQEALGKP